MEEWVVCRQFGGARNILRIVDGKMIRGKDERRRAGELAFEGKGAEGGDGAAEWGLLKEACPEGRRPGWPPAST